MCVCTSALDPRQKKTTTVRERGDERLLKREKDADI